jgi:hypothetical protein
MAAMAAMAAVVRSTEIEHCGNSMIHRQDPFEMSTECSWAGEQDQFVPIPSAELGSSPSEEHGSTPTDELRSTPLGVFGSTSASSDVFKASSRLGQFGAKPWTDQHTIWYLASQ